MLLFGSCLALRIILLGQAKNSWYEKEDAEPFIVESEEEYLNFEAEMNIERKNYTSILLLIRF